MSKKDPFLEQLLGHQRPTWHLVLALRIIGVVADAYYACAWTWAKLTRRTF